MNTDITGINGLKEQTDATNRVIRLGLDLNDPSKAKNILEALEAALLNFKGTIIAVSHDRYFIKKLSTRILELNPRYSESGGYIDYKDGYEEFINYKKNYLDNINGGDKPAGNGDIDAEKERGIAEQEEQRQIKKRREQEEKEKKSTETEIKKTEKRIAELDYMIKDDEVEANYVKLNEIYAEKIILEEKLEELYEKYYSFDDS